MVQVIDLDLPVYNLVQEVPAVVPVMVGLGLDGVTSPALLKTAGRFMTLRKGAAMKQIPLSELIEQLEQAGFEVDDHESE